MSNEIAILETQALVEKGLTETEAALVIDFKERGLPGVSQLRADHLKGLYRMGYSCQDIAAQFPEYKLDLLLYARVKFDWDKDRQEYLSALASHVQPQNAGVAMAEALRFMKDIQNATHVRYRQEIMRYMANPERETPPDFLPKTLHGYSNLVAAMQEIIAPKGKESANNGAPQINMNVTGNVKIVEGGKTPKDVGQILIDRMNAKKKT